MTVDPMLSGFHMSDFAKHAIKNWLLEFVE